jgi:hypothetical protein
MQDLARGVPAPGSQPPHVTPTRPSPFWCFLLVATAALLAVGCSPRKQSRLNREDAAKIAREKAPPVAIRVTGGDFGITDAEGRPVLTGRIPDADAVIQPGDANGGPIDCGHYVPEEAPDAVFDAFMRHFKV